MTNNNNEEEYSQLKINVIGALTLVFIIPAVLAYSIIYKLVKHKDYEI